MLDREDRFYAPDGGIYPGGPSIWNVVDWDQRRLVSVKMDDEQDSPDDAFAGLLKHIDTLPPDVCLVHLSPDGEIISTSNDPKDDETTCVFRPLPGTAHLPGGIETISRAQLREVARLGPNVDMVTEVGAARPEEKFVFKYFFMFQHLDFNWHEMNLWCRLKHPNIVPFGKVVIDEVEGGIVGFTSKYIPGGTLDENQARAFKLKWLHQLIQVVDDLNFKFGIAHQDVAPRNILIDEVTDSLMLFDFDFSARMGNMGFSEPRNDVKGVVFTMFEIITQDSARRDKRHEEQDVEEVDKIDWTPHPDVQLDHPVAEFRKVLDEWRQRRRERAAQVEDESQRLAFLDWPPLPDPPLMPTSVRYIGKPEPVIEFRKQYSWKRAELLAEGKTVLNWQRPPRKWPKTANGGDEVHEDNITSA